MMFHVKHSVATVLAWVLCFVVLPLPLVGFLDARLVDAPQRILVTDLGLLAYVWWLVATALSTRPLWLERVIGLPSLYFLHGVLGVAALISAGLHVLFSTTFHALTRITGLSAWYIELFTVLAAIVFLSGWITDRVGWMRRFRRWWEKVITHEVSVWIHRLNFVAIALILIHISSIPRVNRLTGFMVVLWIYSALALGTYAWAKFVAPVAPSRQGTVVANTTVTPSTWQIVIALDSHACLPQPGDFYFISFHGVPHFSSVAHPFSVSSLDRAKRTVTFTIHASGDLTARIGDVSTGTPVLLEGPFGQFDKEIERHADSPLVLIGMGAGIAPLLGIAQAWAGKRQMCVLDIVSRKADLYYARDFESLTGVEFRSHLHRVTAEDVRQVVNPDLLAKGLFIVVGPAAGVIGTEHVLRNCGVVRNRLCDERLTM
jgi:predicted ferric reductase